MVTETLGLRVGERNRLIKPWPCWQIRVALQCEGRHVWYKGQSTFPTWVFLSGNSLMLLKFWSRSPLLFSDCYPHAKSQSAEECCWKNEEPQYLCCKHHPKKAFSPAVIWKLTATFWLFFQTICVTSNREMTISVQADMVTVTTHFRSLQLPVPGRYCSSILYV